MNGHIDDFYNISEAEAKFEEKFHYYTGNKWSEKDYFKEKTGKYKLLDKFKKKQQIKEAFQKESELLKLIAAGQNKFKDTALDKEVLSLVKNLFNIERMKICMGEHSLDLDKLPMGLLTMEKIKRCHMILCEIQKILVTTPDNSKQGLIISLTNDFYVTIPHNFGMKKPPILDHLMRVKEKTRVLEQLQDIHTMQQILLQSMRFDLQQKHPYETLYDELCLKLTRLPEESDLFQIINKAAYNT